MKNTFGLLKKIGFIFLLMVFIGACTPGNGETPVSSESKFLYVNMVSYPNYVKAYSINSDGTLTEISGSPYATGGSGIGGWYAANTLSLSRTKNLLFASNNISNTITVFSINSGTGALTAAGSPVSVTDGIQNSGALAMDPGGNFLFVSNDAYKISVFSIASDGTITEISGSPFSLSCSSDIDGIQLNPSGNKLFAAQPYCGVTAVMDVASDGTLTEITGSPFTYTGSGYIGSFAFVSDSLAVSNSGEDVTTYSVASDGTPTVTDILKIDTGNECVSVSPSGNFAVASGGYSSKITIARIASDGTITQVSGSPFTTSQILSGYALVSSGDKYLYATEFGYIEAFSLDSSGVPTSIGTYDTYSQSGSYNFGFAIY